MAKGSGIETAEIILDLLKQRGLKLALAESCTGGYISHLITSIPGASALFKGSVVSYSEDVKQKVLDVIPETISRHGTVSPECAFEMARGIIRATGADVALSTTGNLGPDPIENKPVGLVYVSVCIGERTETREFSFNGTREHIKHEASLAALRFIEEKILAWT